MAQTDILCGRGGLTNHHRGKFKCDQLCGCFLFFKPFLTHPLDVVLLPLSYLCLGNKRFRDIVALHRPDYVRAPKIQKPSVARVIVRAIRNGDPPGRFLRKDEKSGKWIDIGDKRAAEKTSQALREKTNEEREKRASSGNFTSQTLVLLSPTGHKKGGRKKSAPKAENGAADAASSGPVAAADDEAKTSETEPAAEAKNEDETTPMEVEGEQGATAEV